MDSPLAPYSGRKHGGQVCDVKGILQIARGSEGSAKRARPLAGVISNWVAVNFVLWTKFPCQQMLLFRTDDF